MPGCVLSVLAALCCAALCCRAHLQPRSSQLQEQEQPSTQQLLRWGGTSILLRDEDEARRYGEDSGEASSSSEEVVQQPQFPEVSKRRKGPTLSVVSPLEVLRQRLRLDRAKERIRENQKQIVANEELLEKIGKRSMMLLSPQQRSRMMAQQP